jgi:hypothetical protein
MRGIGHMGSKGFYGSRTILTSDSIYNFCSGIIVVGLDLQHGCNFYAIRTERPHTQTHYATRAVALLRPLFSSSFYRHWMCERRYGAELVQRRVDQGCALFQRVVELRILRHAYNRRGGLLLDCNRVGKRVHNLYQDLHTIQAGRQFEGLPALRR